MQKFFTLGQDHDRLGWTVTLYLFSAPHPIDSFHPLSPSPQQPFRNIPSDPSEGHLILHFLTTNPSPNQHPILISVPSHASPSITLPLAPICFFFSGSTPSLISLAFLQLQGHSSSTPYQSLGLNCFFSFHLPIPVSGCTSRPPVAVPFFSEFCQYQGPYLSPSFSWPCDCYSQSLETLLASPYPTFLCLSLSFLDPCLTLDAVIITGLWSFFTFVAVLFPYLLIFLNVLKSHYLSDACAQVFINAMI